MAAGQNICSGTGTPASECLELWHDEIKDFTYGGSNKLNKVGHYTQEELAKVTGIGCGYALCANNKAFWVCNYSHGQSTDDVKRPWSEGKDCADCSGTCNNGLCDCGGKVCANGGILKVETCACGCEEPFYGATCDNVDCSKPDIPACNSSAQWTKDNCHNYSNFKSDCRHMCGYCSK